MPKTKTPEQFIAQGQLAESLLKGSKSIFERNLAEGALRLVEVDGTKITHPKLGNNEAKISEVLNQTSLVGGGILDKNPAFVEQDIEKNIIEAENVPEAYFKLQQKIARKQGYGDIEITGKLRDTVVDTLRDDQRSSLSRWANYLRDESNQNTYPDWFKLYAWESVKRLGDFNKEKGRFDKRTKTTAGVYPEVDPEALAYVYDKIDLHILQGMQPEDDLLTRLIASKAGFGELYTYAIAEAGMAITPEQREIVAGEWKVYRQIDGQYSPDYSYNEDGQASDRTVVDSPVAMGLAESLQGYRTGWCTAGNRTAAHQLTMGDFYVFYTDDGEGNNTIPRIAIRMENGQVSEVRGIEVGQNLEANMEDILLEKLEALPGGDKYFTKVENMRRVTEIDERVQDGGELTGEDLMFLRFSGKVEGFGDTKDPRITALLQGHFVKEDIEIVLASGIDPTEFTQTLVKNGAYRVIADNLTVLIEAGANPTKLANNLMKNGEYWAIADNLTVLIEAGADIDPTEFAQTLVKNGAYRVIADNLTVLIEAGANIDPTKLAQTLMKNGEYWAIARNLTAFVEAGANPTKLANNLMKNGEYWVIANHITAFVEAGANPTKLANNLIKNGEYWAIARNLTAFVEAGVPREELNRMLQ